ncbi:hypothetical protein OG585_29015 [Streptomyces sp. NBC_01340]|uniref:hypothetical protein n=1 Tax=unclassified Streptomyces TaxID=2593676 RepID=UPI0022552A74|nr:MULTISPECIES: hypothetical protein [unclassified Streptomyces]MCX4456624.1 hypothetical protein [Streptomyces sp. NBC_01719]MCX4495982.1 hypothetical protein [Streptomyces sp. NBC_01728]WSI40921.1 hypothetical protein OG585_29015 [Streptomyces sp. NBC_01340]
MTEQLLDRALVEEATKKSGLIWVRGSGASTHGAPGAEAPTRALWHVWHDGAACLVGDGPGEQPLPGLVDGGDAVVTVRSKDKGGRLVTWTAKAVELAPGSPAWEATVAELKGKRLNAPDGEEMPARWARECRVLRLEPRAGIHPLPDGSLAAAPLPTPATTRQPIPAAVPRLLFRKRGRRG